MKENFSIEQLSEQLSKGFVFFQFTKKDGTLRNVIGTRNPKIIDLLWKSSASESGKGRTPSPMVLTFFDLTCMDFRSMLRTADFKVINSFLPLENAFQVATNLARECGDIEMTAMLNQKGVELFENAENMATIIDLDTQGGCYRESEESASAPSFAVTEQHVSGRVIEEKSKMDLIAELIAIRKQMAIMSEREKEILELL